MNPKLENYFEMIEVRLLQSYAIADYQVLRKEISPLDGKIRINASLRDGGGVEFFEYVIVADDEIQLLKYSYHWQNADDTLQQRWDNAPHYPELANAPHHIHEANGNIRENSELPNFFAIIAQIESSLPASE